MVSKDKFNTFWWQADEENIYTYVWDAAMYIADNQQYRSYGDLRHLRLYGNLPIAGLTANQYARAPSTSFSSDSRLTLNVVHSMVSTIVSKIMRNRPRPLFLTSGADYSMKRKAKLLNKFTQGLFYASDIYEVGEDVCRDACIFGTGFMKIYENDGNIVGERVFPHEILIDDAEAIYGTPRQAFQRKQVNREVLIGLYPEKEQEILSATMERDGSSTMAIATHVTVIEAWHLPSSRDSEDGRHSIVIDSVTLLDEPYNRPYFPFVSLRWSDRGMGYWGQGIAEQLTGLQIEINKMLKTIQISLHLCSIPKIFIERGSKVSKGHINNEIGGVIEYAGTAPIYKTANAVSPEMFLHLDRLYSRAYEIVGVSQLSASARKPSGIESGRALREFSDIESERFLAFGRAYEKMYLDAAKQMVNIARDIANEGKSDFSITAFSKDNLESIEWGDIDLAEDQYVMQIYPTALLPVTPAARLQTVEEMMRSGLLSREDGLALLDFPDIESVQSLENAAVEEIDMIIETIIEKGVYIAPEPFSNLALSMKKMNQAYIRARLDGVDEDRLGLMRRFVADSSSLMNEAMQAQQQQMMAQQMQAAQLQAQAQAANAPPQAEPSGVMSELAQMPGQELPS